MCAQTCVCIYVDNCVHMYGDMRVGMCVHCAHLCIDMCTQIRLDMRTNVRAAICADMCGDMCADTCVDMCADMRADMHVDIRKGGEWVTDFLKKKKTSTRVHKKVRNGSGVCQIELSASQTSSLR